MDLQDLFDLVIRGIAIYVIVVSWKSHRRYALLAIAATVLRFDFVDLSPTWWWVWIVTLAVALRSPRWGGIMVKLLIAALVVTLSVKALVATYEAGYEDGRSAPPAVPTEPAQFI